MSPFENFRLEKLCSKIVYSSGFFQNFPFDVARPSEKRPKKVKNALGFIFLICAGAYFGMREIFSRDIFYHLSISASV